MSDVVDEAEFELCQEDDIVAHTSGPRASALREILHYAAVYGQDGPVQVFEITRTPVPLPASLTPTTIQGDAE